MKSTHKAEVVPVVLEKHPNADALSIVRVFGYTVVVNTEQWKGIDKAVYIVPDSIVNTLKSEFAFLRENSGHSSKSIDYKVRVKVKKLRGVVSMGLLIPAPAGANIGDDLAEFYRIERYEPAVGTTMNDDCIGAPSGLYCPKYDIDSYHRYLDLFEDGEPVYISEKIHGANSRYTYVDGQFYCGSRTQWKKYNEKNLWWELFNRNPGIQRFCLDHPRYILYGEAYGQVQNLKYDLAHNQFAAFDVQQPDGTFWGVDRFLDGLEVYGYKHDLRLAPQIAYNLPLDKSTVLQYAEGKSLIASHVREGCVIKPMEERQTDEIGRLVLKIVGNGYYEKVK